MTIKEVQSKVNYFVVKHIYILVLIWLITIVNININEGKNKESNEKMAKDITQMQQSYIAIDRLGRLLNLPRNYVSAVDQEDRIAKELGLLLVDVLDISENFTITKLESDRDIINNSLALQTFFFNYIKVDRNKNELLAQKEQTALGYFLAYRKQILELFKGKIDSQDNVYRLPHKIKIIENTVLKYKVDEKDNSFIIEVQYATSNSEFESSKKTKDGKIVNLWKDSTAMSTIVATGYFDVTTQNIGTNFEAIKGKNFDGLHFETFTVNLGL